MSECTKLGRSDELVSAVAEVVAGGEGNSAWATACSVLTAVERALGDDLSAGNYRYLVDCATTTALSGFAQLGDAAAGPTVSALELIRTKAGLDPKPVAYDTETITLPKGALRAIQRAAR